jgi:undecaprenyl-diphosphatase
LHAASLIALVAYFIGELLDLARGMTSGDTEARKLFALLVIGTIPAALAGVLLGDYFERAFADPRSAAVQLVITAVILVGAELALSYNERRAAMGGSRLRRLDDLRYEDAGIVGVAQAISILPGISRSGSTIAAGLALSVQRDDAARFSFLLAIPALFGATLVELPKLAGTSLGTGSAAVGFFASLVTSYVAIAALIRYLKTNTLYPFAIYCVVAGVVFFVLV